MGHNAIHTEEIGRQRAKDLDHIAFAIQEGRVIATRDSHFHMHIANSGQLAPSVILIRLASFTDESIAEIVNRMCSRHNQALKSGCLLTYKEKSVRLRSLPIKKVVSIRRT